MENDIDEAARERRRADAGPPAGPLEAPKRSPGRPRDPNIDRILVDTALRELITYGFAGMSIDRIAKDSGINKPAIYRRFRNKTLLAVAALEALALEKSAEMTGDVEADLVNMIAEAADNLQRSGALPLLGTLLAELKRDPALIAAYRERLYWPRHNKVRDILLRGQQEGVIRQGVELDVPIRLLLGLIASSFIFVGKNRLARKDISRAVKMVVSQLR